LTLLSRRYQIGFSITCNAYFVFFIGLPSKTEDQKIQ